MKNYDKNRFKTMTTSELKERKTQIRDTLPTFDHVIHGANAPIKQTVIARKINCKCAKK